MAATADLAGRTFAFFRIDETLLAPRLHLQANGLVEGSPDQNETYWEFQDGKLVFLNAGRRPTTRFQWLLINDTGHPKLDRLYAARDRPAWPIEGQPQNYRLIWAPHHSIGDDWLGFGTFVETHAAMLRWAQEDGGVDFVLKPHPALFTRIRGERPDLAPGLEQFLTEWGGLPNTALVEGGDYGALLAASNAMVTDGISFLAEYQLFDKPLVFLDSGRHVPFNDVGQLVATGAWTVGNVDAARSVLAALRAGEPDALASTRQAILNELLPFPGRSADRVLDEIRGGLLAGG